VTGASSGTTEAATPTTIQIQGEHTAVALKKISGAVSVKTTHENVSAEDVTGLLDVDTTHSRVDATRVGALKVKNDHDAVRARFVAGGVDIANDHGEVVVSDFGAACSIRTKFDTVRLAPSADQVGDVTVDNEHGRIEASLPANRGYRVVPTVDRGSLRLDAPFAQTASDATGSKVVLRTSYDDIVVRTLNTAAAERVPA